MKKLFLILMFQTFVGCMFAQLPKVTLKDINGKAVSIDTLQNSGRPFIIDFFATWCKPCNRELNAINEVYPDWQDETGVRLIIVSTDQAHNIHKVKPLVDSHGWEFEQVLLDPNQELARALGNASGIMPFTIIVDGKGQIAYKHNGYTEGAESELIAKVRELIKQ